MPRLLIIIFAMPLRYAAVFHAMLRHICCYYATLILIADAAAAITLLFTLIRHAAARHTYDIDAMPLRFMPCAILMAFHATADAFA